MRTLPFALAVLSVFVLIDNTQTVSGGEIGFEFEGSVHQSNSDPYGQVIDVGAPINGRFIYDTDSAATYMLEHCECVGYRQQIVGGFFADFGDVHIRADDFIVEVVNDILQPKDLLSDMITIRFADNSFADNNNRILTQPINVNDVPHANGVFEISFVAFGSSPLSSASLPQTIDHSVYSSGLNRLSDSTEYFPPSGVVFSLASLRSFSVIDGDYNFDGIVNKADLDVWADNFGSTGNLAGDGNRNGIVDAADFTVWRDNVSQSISVPEPLYSFASHTLFLVILLASLSHGRRR